MSEKRPIVLFEIVNFGKIEVELYPDIAPNTVNNFISLVKEGFYNGLTFHRIIEGFMIQGGCPRGNGTGGPSYSIKGEFLANGVNNTLKHEKGVISMARAMNPDSAGSQFFISSISIGNLFPLSKLPLIIASLYPLSFKVLMVSSAPSIKGILSHTF